MRMEPLALLGLLHMKMTNSVEMTFLNPTWDRSDVVCLVWSLARKPQRFCAGHLGKEMSGGT